MFLKILQKHSDDDLLVLKKRLSQDESYPERGQKKNYQTQVPLVTFKETFCNNGGGLKIKLQNSKSPKMLRIDTNEFTRLSEKDQLSSEHQKVEEKKLAQNTHILKGANLLDKLKGRTTMMGFTLFQPTHPQDCLETNRNEQEQLNSAPNVRSSSNTKKTKPIQTRSKSTIFKGKKFLRNQFDCGLSPEPNNKNRNLLKHVENGSSRTTKWIPPLQVSVLTSSHSGIVNIRTLKTTRNKEMAESIANFFEDGNSARKHKNLYSLEKRGDSFGSIEGKIVKIMQS